MKHALSFLEASEKKVDWASLLGSSTLFEKKAVRQVKVRLQNLLASCAFDRSLAYHCNTAAFRTTTLLPDAYTPPSSCRFSTCTLGQVIMTARRHGVALSHDSVALGVSGSWAVRAPQEQRHLQTARLPLEKFAVARTDVSVVWATTWAAWATAWAARATTWAVWATRRGRRGGRRGRRGGRRGRRGGRRGRRRRWRGCRGSSAISDGAAVAGEP